MKFSQEKRVMLVNALTTVIRVHKIEYFSDLPKITPKVLKTIENLKAEEVNALTMFLSELTGNAMFTSIFGNQQKGNLFDMLREVLRKFVRLQHVYFAPQVHERRLRRAE
jgi:hypothetical protein